MSNYYFVTFESRSKPDALVKTVSNVILKDVHPVIWLANPPDAYENIGLDICCFGQKSQKTLRLKALSIRR